VIGVEGALRFFVFDGISSALPHARLSSADRVTVRCRSVKSVSEIDLLQHSADLTVVAFEECLRTLREGMLQEEFTENSISVYRRLGVEGSIDIQFGLATSLPHGSEHPSHLKAGDVVLMDGGCTVEGYHSDMSRTVVFGEPTKRQREIWLLEQAAQAAAFAAARPGIPIEDVDAAARRVIVDAGLGPDYKVPGLPHRTGHGIGLDIHEAPYVVEGNRTRLALGMCFSNEPMIVIPGEFGVRLEDCLFMNQSEACYFTEPSLSIDMPLARRNANGQALE
jgi:Xaa-Pro dipeptidase